MKYLTRMFGENGFEDPQYFIKPGWIVTNRRHGFIKLAYKAIATDLSVKFCCDFEIEEIPSIIKAGYVLNYGEKIDISENLEEAKKIVKKIFTKLNLNYQISKYPVYLTGGGAYFFGEMLKENKIPNLIVDEDLFLNVKGYERILMEKVNNSLFNS